MASVFEGLSQEETQQLVQAAVEALVERVTSWDADNPLPSADYTGAFSPLDAGGIDVAAGAEVLLVAANPARVKVSVNHAGATGTGNLWLGFSATAEENVGEWLEPGGRWEEYFTGAVRVKNDGDVAIRVTWVEWGT